MLCQVLALSCLKNFSALSNLVLFCVPDNKRLEFELEVIAHGLVTVVTVTMNS